MSNKNTFIDNDDDHHRILFELGILDDEEDWPLFQKMQDQQMKDDPDFEIYEKYVKLGKTLRREQINMDKLIVLQKEAGQWDASTQCLVAEILKKQQSNIEKLEIVNRTFREIISANTKRNMTLEDRFFSIEGDGFILDNNFDFDAGLKVSGDFIDNEKNEYAQMIVSALNKVAKEDRNDEQRRVIESIENTESTEIRKLKEAIEEQKLSIIALNDCIGGEGSCTTDNLVRVGRLEHTIEFLKRKNEILAMALQEAVDGMGGSYAIWSGKAKNALEYDGDEE